jgi:hypothetical protein
MVNLFVKLIQKGLWTLEQVPEQFRAEVAALLN